jgi:hypothetical protein
MEDKMALFRRKSNQPPPVRYTQPVQQTPMAPPDGSQQASYYSQMQRQRAQAGQLGYLQRRSYVRQQLKDDPAHEERKQTKAKIKTLQEERKESKKYMDKIEKQIQEEKRREYYLKRQQKEVALAAKRDLKPPRRGRIPNSSGPAWKPHNPRRRRI